MELDVSKLWLVGAGVVLGAIAGAGIWAQRAASIAHRAAAQAGEDALLQTAQHLGTASLAAAMKGAFGGAVIGGLAALAYLYFTNPDREMNIRKMPPDDD